MRKTNKSRKVNGKEQVVSIYTTVRYGLFLLKTQEQARRARLLLLTSCGSKGMARSRRMLSFRVYGLVFRV